MPSYLLAFLASVSPVSTIFILSGPEPQPKISELPSILPGCSSHGSSWLPRSTHLGICWQRSFPDCLILKSPSCSLCPQPAPTFCSFSALTSIYQFGYFSAIYLSHSQAGSMNISPLYIPAASLVPRNMPGI